MDSSLYKKYLSTHLKFSHQKEGKLLIEEEVKNYYIPFYKDLIPKNKDIKILDIGSGFGHFLLFLKIMGYKNFLGIDISLESKKFIEKNITKKIKMVNIFSFLKKNKNKFDLIHSRDFLEHINKNKTLELLKLIYKNLNKNGQLIISTTNAMGLTGFFFRYIDFTHHQTFTENIIYQLLVNTGFKKINYFPSLVKFRYMNLKLKIIYLLYLKPLWFLRKLGFYLEGIRPVPKVYHYHFTFIAKK